MAANTSDRMADYEKTHSLDTDFSILETKELVGLDVVPMKSKDSYIILEIEMFGSNVGWYMSIMEEIDY